MNDSQEQVAGILDPLLDLQCGYIAKSEGEQLWSHAWACASVATEIAKNIPSFGSREQRVVLLACLTHDIGKISNENQAILRGEKEGQVTHKLTLEDYRWFVGEAARESGFTDEEIESAWEASFIHHFVAQSDIGEIKSSRTAELSRLVRKADRLVSLESPDIIQIDDLLREYEDLVEYTTVLFGRFPSATTDFVLQQTEHHYNQKGWRLILTWENALLFIADSESPSLPNKEEFLTFILEQFYRETLACRQFKPSFTGTFLSGISEAHPELLIQAQEDNLLEGLGDTRRSLYFCKLAHEILRSKKRLAEVEEESPALQCVTYANSTAHHAKARKLCQESFGFGGDEKVNSDFFNKLFEKITVRDLLPCSDIYNVEPDKELRKCSPTELLSILKDLAALDATEECRDFDQRAWRLFDALLMTEESSVDFAGYAKEQLDRYCVYKTTMKADESLCERCGATLPSTITNADNFALKSQAATQIKSRYGPQRALCPLCTFDNLKLREDGKDYVWCKLDTRAPMQVDPGEMDNLVTSVISGLLQKGTRYVERDNMKPIASLPVPKVFLPYAEQSKITCVHRNDHEMLFRLQPLLNGQTIRDAAVMYMPVYHLLNLMGFRVSIGSLEHRGLFGQAPPVSRQAYWFGIATNILAQNIASSKNGARNMYLRAWELLKERPSIAISTAFKEKQESNDPLLKAETLKIWLTAMKESDALITELKGGLTMDTLLNDAAFLASKMQVYCADIYKNNSVSKHSASKPIVQALNELLRNRSTDIAKQKFREHLKQNLKAETAAQLPEFISQVDEIIDRFAALRDQSIPDFLKTKNALASAVYTFTRYKELIPEQKGGK